MYITTHEVSGKKSKQNTPGYYERMNEVVEFSMRLSH